MTTNSKNPKTKNIKTQYDDLTVIDGIGQARQKWLREIFNVHTFADLAALSPDTIEAQLKAEKKIVAHTEIAEWIAQAKKHTADAAKLPSTASSTENWKTAATFVVVFEERKDASGQTLRRATIHRIEADETQTKVEQAELYNWMRTWFGEPPTPTITEVKAAPEPLSTPTMQPMFTSKMTQMIAKTQPSQGKPQPPLPTVTVSAESVQTTLNPPKSPVSPGKDLAFSPRMQELIAKVQALEKRK